MGKGKKGHEVPLLGDHVAVPDTRSGEIWVERHSDKPGLYSVLAGFLRFCMNVFFAQIEVVGKHFIQREGTGPVIFAGNHPNALLDPVMVLTHCRRVVRFGAKDTLFDNPVIRFFAHNLGAVPIRRRQDQKDGQAPVDNSSAFDCFYDVLENGGTVGLFPEGVSHTESQMSKLKTGTARVALHVARHLYRDNAPEDFQLHIVPCGLNYDVRHKFRSRVLLQYGMPIVVGEDWAKRAIQSERETVLALTEELDNAIRNVTLNADDWETLHLLHTCVSLLDRKSGASKLTYRSHQLNRQLLEGYKQKANEPDVVTFRQDLTDYRTALDSLNLKDHHVRDARSRALTTVFFLQRLLFFLILMPFAVVGIAFHFPVVLLSYIAGKRYGHEKDVVATYKVLIAILFVPVIYITTIVVTGVVTRNLVPWLQATIMVALLCLLPFSGYAMVRFYEIEASVGRAAIRFARVITYNQSVSELQEQRSGLEERLRNLVRKYRGEVDGGRPSPRPRAASLEIRAEEDRIRREQSASGKARKKARKEKRGGEEAPSNNDTDADNSGMVSIDIDGDGTQPAEEEALISLESSGSGDDQ